MVKEHFAWRCLQWHGDVGGSEAGEVVEHRFRVWTDSLKAGECLVL